MLGIVIIISIILVCLVLVYLGFAFAYHDITGDSQKISYDEFIKLAAVAPEKWCISDWVYSCVYYDGTKIFMKTYFDQLRLARLKKKDDKLAFQSAMDKKRAELIKSWQSDINNYRSEYMDAVKTYINEGKIL